MRDVLKFVQGSAAKKDVLPVLTHFSIANGRIMGYNGRIAISSPIQLDITAAPKAEAFIRAIDTCDEEIALHVTPAGKLGIRSGKFKAFIDCTTETFPAIVPQGEHIPVDENFLPALKALEAFTAEDAARKWANAVLFRGRSAFATNNVCLVEFWMRGDVPREVAVPALTVRELLRIKEQPTSMQVNENAATFHYTGGRWLHTTLYDTAWPDLSRILDKPSNAIPVHPELRSAVATLAPFTDVMERIYIWPGHVGTVPTGTEGANVALDGIDFYGCYNEQQLTLALQLGTRFDFSTYPAPALFFGDNVRGAIIGLKQ